MKPVVSAAEMRAADEVAVAEVGHDVLVARAGAATALGAVAMLEHVYGARVTVLCGPGSNGADGRVAARHLAARGVAVTVLEAVSAPRRLAAADLVVDAAFGTGLSRPWDAPDAGDTPVLAVDLPSGVDPDTGSTAGRSLRATRTIAMAAVKRGHLQGEGASLCGTVQVADLGIAVRDATVGLVEDADLARIAPLGRDDHKWRRSVVVVAGSPGMLGAPALVCAGALSVQAGMVQLCVPGASGEQGPWPTEVVRLAASDGELAGVVGGVLDRAHALVIGPGLGRTASLRRAIVDLLAICQVPVVLDADALHLVDPDHLAARQARGGSPIVLTPHDGEYGSLLGAAPGEDRITAAQHGAARTGCTMLLKGATTVVASSEHQVHEADQGRRAATPPTLVVTSGTPDLATPGSGDVLAGAIAGLLASGLPAPLAAGLGAHVHGRAGRELAATCRATLLPAAIADQLARRRLVEVPSGGRTADGPV